MATDKVLSKLKEKLKEKAPGFLDDRDERWFTWAESKDSTQLRRLRADYFAYDEELEDAETVADRKQLIINLTSICREVVDSIDQMKERARLRNQQNTDNLTTRLSHTENVAQTKPRQSENLSKPETKKKPQSNQQPHKEKELEQEKEVKQRHAGIGSVMDIDPDDITFDDYVPAKKSMPKKNKQAISKKQRLDTEEAMNWSPIESKQKESKQTPQIDPLIDGIKDEKMVNSLLELKPLINKYDCRDRVLKFISLMIKQETKMYTFERYSRWIDEENLKLHIR